MSTSESSRKGVPGQHQPVENGLNRWQSVWIKTTSDQGHWRDVDETRASGRRNATYFRLDARRCIKAPNQTFVVRQDKTVVMVTRRSAQRRAVIDSQVGMVAEVLPANAEPSTTCAISTKQKVNVEVSFLCGASAKSRGLSSSQVMKERYLGSEITMEMAVAPRATESSVKARPTDVQTPLKINAQQRGQSVSKFKHPCEEENRVGGDLPSPQRATANSGNEGQKPVWKWLLKALVVSAAILLNHSSCPDEKQSSKLRDHSRMDFCVLPWGCQP
ncbi:hypothetical protein BSKO_08116 [Bryopsis sp. KO-2023]|nr:hypothetical protein BSKO_08116 [Bryopsis sp. KO-2023]